MKAYDEDKEELYHIAGDEDTGYAIDTSPSKAFIKPQIRYDGKYGKMVLTVDVYKTPDGKLSVHLLCPSCRHACWVKPEVKAIDLDGDLLSVESWLCPWEKGRGTDETSTDRMEFGLGLCRARLVIDKNVARDA